VFSDLLLASIVAAVVSTLGMFVGRAHESAGALMWTKRLVFTLIGTGVLAAVGAEAGYLLHDRLDWARTTFVVMVLASLVWLPVTRRWNARAHLCWSSNMMLYVVYLIFILNWTFESPLGTLGRIGAMSLWCLEVVAAVMGAAYLWELCDAMGSERWVRRVRNGVEDPATERHPFVSLHVPAHEEPPDMVIDTLASLKKLDYDRFEIIAIDDNTKDESLWRPVETWCRENGVKFAHLENWPGYKSGALNYALQEMTDPEAELIGVVDSDYQLEPDFLARCAPLFNDPDLGFIQSPQDYREWENAPFYRRLYYSYKYFFAVSQPSRNERDGAIFAGTMGLIRRQALEEVGGWDQWCITEDAELSLRVLRAGWSGLHVDASFGHGVMPLTFEALKGQRFRWCFGGIQILRMHWRELLPGRGHAGRRSPDANHLSAGQRWAYLSGGLQWYGDLIGVIFFLFLLAGAANLGLGGGLLFRKLSPFLLGVIPVLSTLGLVRAVALVRRGTNAGWREAFGAFLIWQSTSLVVARASVLGLFSKKAEFLRTPKTADHGSIWRAISANRSECLLALLGLVGIGIGITHLNESAGQVTAGLLALPTLAFLAAPANSWAAQRAALPADLEARRRLENRRYTILRPAGAAIGGLATTGGAMALVLFLMAPGGQDVLPPSLAAPHGVGPDAPIKPKPTTPSPVGTESPSPGATTSSTPTGTTSPTTSTSPTGSASPSSSPSPSPSRKRTTSPTASSSPTASPTSASPAASEGSPITPTPSATASSAADVTSSPTATPTSDWPPRGPGNNNGHGHGHG